MCCYFERWQINFEKIKTMSEEIRNFINSLTIKEYNRLRGSLSNAEARRILLEKAIKNDKII